MARILEMATSLGEDELSVLLRGIAERSQERAKVSRPLPFTSRRVMFYCRKRRQ